MSERELLHKIFNIMRRLLIVPYGACGQPAPRKGTTRRECYQALYEIQELLGSNRVCTFWEREQTNADRIRAMTDEELADRIMGYVRCDACEKEFHIECNPLKTCRGVWLEWLKKEVDE